MEFADAIKEHLALQRRNARLERSLPLEQDRAELAAASIDLPRRQPALACDPDEETRPCWPAFPELDRAR
jgi:hypothetical protein